MSRRILLPSCFLLLGALLATECGSGVVAEVPVSNHVYSIEVVTGSVEGAGTDSNVYLQISGERDGQQTKSPLLHLEGGSVYTYVFGDNGPTDLRPEGGLFEHDTIARFSRHLSDLGDLRKISLRKDESGSGPDWFLAFVKVSLESGDHGHPLKVAYFPYNQWLQSGQLEATIPKARNPQVVKFQVVTGTRNDAGTDASIWLQMMGDPDNTPWLLLDNQDNNFETGDVDYFRFLIDYYPFDLVRDSPDTYYDRLHEIRLRLYYSGEGDGWYLQSVTYSVSSQDPTILAESACSRWLPNPAQTRLGYYMLRILPGCSYL